MHICPKGICNEISRKEEKIPSPKLSQTHRNRNRNQKVVFTLHTMKLPFSVQDQVSSLDSDSDQMTSNNGVTNHVFNVLNPSKKFPLVQILKSTIVRAKHGGFGTKTK